MRFRLYGSPPEQCHAHADERSAARSPPWSHATDSLGTAKVKVTFFETIRLVNTRGSRRASGPATTTVPLVARPMMAPHQETSKLRAVCCRTVCGDMGQRCRKLRAAFTTTRWDIEMP